MTTGIARGFRLRGPGKDSRLEGLCGLHRRPGTTRTRWHDAPAGSPVQPCSGCVCCAPWRPRWPAGSGSRPWRRSSHPRPRRSRLPTACVRSCADVGPSARPSCSVPARRSRASTGVRAARAPAGALDIRLLVFNTGTEPPRTDSLLRRLGASDADVVVLVEAPPELVRLLHRESPLASSYPHVLMRGPSPDRTTWRIVLSRWPLEDRRTDRQLVCVVGAPVGGFGLIAVHPASPRDPRRWRWGNQLVEDAARCARDLAEEGLPVIVAGDLNATPSGWRSRLLRDRASLRRCKPLLVPAGTFPASLPPALRLALDDAWVSDEFAVSRWRLGPAEGSDHASVRIDLRLDPGPGGDGPAGAPGAPGGLAPGR
jgi:endonuclease/exonuclease/phosphatase (EEP) superfamily protein YafD